MTYLWPGRGSADIDYISGPPSGEYCKKYPRNIAILGSTGSIGQNAVSVIEAHPDRLRVCALACGRNVELLARQARRHRPRLLCALDIGHARELEALLPDGYRPRILFGQDGYRELASMEEADCVLCAQVGAAGLTGALAAAQSGKVIALANKESLVLGGELLRRVCAKTGAAILPVDSEHYAIFQCLSGRVNVRKLILTASGGPFRGMKKSELKNVTGADALRHPNWKMGAKITIDSATLMNKGLEVIEAMRLYGVPSTAITVLVHPQSIVHSLVEFADNSLLAQMAVPDMRLPIGDCLLWPDNNAPLGEQLFLGGTSLSFEYPDHEAFPCLNLALEAADAVPDAQWRAAGLNPACIVLNAANEAAVDSFIRGECGFNDIPALINVAMDALIRESPPQFPYWAESDPLVAINDLDNRAREVVSQAVKTMLNINGPARTDSLSLAKIGFPEAPRLAGDMAGQAIIDHIRRKYNMVISGSAADMLKTAVLSRGVPGKQDILEVRGRDAVTALPQALQVTQEEIFNAISVNPEVERRKELPRHVAIIMDGNGRWAKMRGLNRSEGHRAGARTVRAIVSECRRLEIPYLTLYAFSSENWKRPKSEIATLFSLLLEFLGQETREMEEKGIQLNVIGDIDGLPAPQAAALRHSMARTSHGGAMRLNLALNYGGRAEIVRAARSMAESGMETDRIDEKTFKDFLYTDGQPDPDLLIRTSGELRLSNFLLYQCAYSELYFTPTLWPDFNVDEFGKALDEYAARRRRFGGAG